MSLIIHTIVRDGIVVCADTRTTCKDGNGNIRYDDSAEKIVPFPNNVVVSHCGDSKISKDITVIEFLYSLRKQYGKRLTIAELPLKLLTEYIRHNGKGDTIFTISGYIYGIQTCTYKVLTKNLQITLTRTPSSFGASYEGVTDIAHAIMNSGIDYNNLSITDAIDLTRECLQENIKIFKYHDLQSIGGICKTYIIDKLHDNIGWLQDDGFAIPDKNAPSDALEQYQNQQIDKMLKQQEKIKKG